ncbi:MAG: MarR family transcriptional regulator [Gemmataceae bacterium]
MSTSPGETTPARTFDSPEQEVYLGLWRTYDRLRAFEDELFAAHNLTAQQYNALRLLRAAHPGSLPTLQLGSRLISRAPDITRMVDRLEAAGLVRRERLPENRRVVQVAITDAGLELLRKLARPVRDCARRQLGHLRPEQQQQLIELLREARSPHEDPHSGW